MAPKFKLFFFSIALGMIILLSACAPASFVESTPLPAEQTSVAQQQAKPISTVTAEAAVKVQPLVVPVSANTTVQENLVASEQVSAQPVEESKSSFIKIDDFRTGLNNGSAQLIRGVYVQDVMALRVVQQPADQPAFVSATQGTVTQFAMATNSGITGLLAHNFASGKLFSNLAVGNKVDVVYGDGSVKSYVVSKVLRFQALQPTSPSSNFVNLDTGENLTASGLFSQVYSGSHHVTFQTCIQEGAVDSWGRLFVVAEPVDENVVASLQ
jgi:hypothetical protein